MAAANNSVDYRCVFCTSTNNDLVDPRELPCGHVGCRTCVIGWVEESEHGDLTCHRCNQLHQRLNFDSLEKIVIDGVSTTLTCDGFNCQVKSVSYCVECDSKFCDTHLQAHNSYFGPRHEEISIDVYQRSPGRYKKVYCDHHKKEPLIKACNKCYKLVCNYCDRGEGHCTDFVAQHEYKSLDEVSEKVTSSLKELLKSADDFGMKIFFQEKESWNNLDEVAEECKEWIKEIERVTDEQIRQINEESEREKGKVQEYLRKSIKEVEASSAVLLAANNQLDVSRLRVRKLMEVGHMTDLIKQMEQMTSELNQSVDVELGTSVPSRNVTLLVKKDPTSFNAEFTQLPSTLTLSSEHDIADCHSACHRVDSDILVACEDGVKVLERETDQLTDWDLPYRKVYSIIEHRHIVYLIHEEDDVCKVGLFSPGNKHALTLFEFRDTFTWEPSLAVSDRHVVVNNPNSHELIIYDGMSHTQAKHKFQARHVHLLPDGQLLTAVVGQLVKYNIADGQLTKIWKCKGLEDIYPVSADLNGIIFASTFNNRQSVYIISPAGELLREIKHDKLPEWPGQISGRDGELAVPDWTDNKLYIFKMHY